MNDLKDLCDEIGSVLIFDEITSGFRMCVGGIHRKYKVEPDICVLAKSLANGYAMSLVLGKSKVMTSAQDTFISSTNWTDRVGPSAAIADITKYMENEVEKHIVKMGEMVKKVWINASKKYNVPIRVTGLPSLCAFSFELKNSNELNTFFYN